MNNNRIKLLFMVLFNYFIMSNAFCYEKTNILSKYAFLLPWQEAGAFFHLLSV
jgi:hypothetical protein